MTSLVTLKSWVDRQGLTPYRAAKVLGVGIRQIYTYIEKDYMIDLGRPMGRMKHFRIYKPVAAGFFNLEELELHESCASQEIFRQGFYPARGVRKGGARPSPPEEQG